MIHIIKDLYIDPEDQCYTLCKKIGMRAGKGKGN